MLNIRLRMHLKQMINDFEIVFLHPPQKKTSAEPQHVRYYPPQNLLRIHNGVFNLHYKENRKRNLLNL